MALKTEYDSIDAIPENARGAYTEKNGKFVLDAEIEDVAGLKESQRRALDEKKRLAAELDQWKKTAGEHKPEEIAALLQAQRDAEEKRMRDAGESEKLIAKRLAERDAEWQKKYDEVAPFRDKYRDRELDIAIRDAAAKAGVISEDMKHVIPIVKGSRIKYDDASGKVVVVDGDGDVTGLSVEKFFAETFKQEAPKFYAAAGGSGGGATGGSGNRTLAPGKVDVTDPNSILANLDALAKGKIAA